MARRGRLAQFLSIALLVLNACATACGAQQATVAVSLFDAYQPTATLFVEGPCELIVPFHRGVPTGLYKVSVEKNGIAVTPVRASSPQLIAGASKVVFTGAGHALLSLRHPAVMVKRHYHGAVELTVRSDRKLKINNSLPIRDYVRSVVASETLPNWPLEALKAQAVLTQTRLFRYLPGDELGDTTQQEVYLGSGNDRADIAAAVASVSGQILAYDHRPIQPFYHSTCAGSTSDGSAIFGKNAEHMVYLASVSCSYCKQSPFCKTTSSRIRQQPFNSIFGSGTTSVATTDSSGRPLEIILGDGRHMRAYDFWIKLGKNFGWDKAPGNRFTIGTDSHGDVLLKSTGAGHGVGLCQWGAAGQARLGRSYREILQYYFPGTQIE